MLDWIQTNETYQVFFDYVRDFFLTKKEFNSVPKAQLVLRRSKVEDPQRGSVQLVINEALITF